MKKLIFYIAICFCLSCSKNKSVVNNTEKNPDEVFYVDVISDSALDTVKLKSFSASDKSLIIYNNKSEQIICIIKNGLIDKKEGEMIVEPNFVNGKKGFRIIRRKINFIPDYKYVDFQFEGIWKISGIGKINTIPEGHLESCYAPISQPVAEISNSKSGDIPILDIDYLIDRSRPSDWQCK